MRGRGGTFTFIKYTPSLGVNPCRMVAKTITNIYEPISRKERNFAYLQWLYRVPPSDQQNVLQKRVCLMSLLEFALIVKIPIHTSERRPAASRMKNGIYALGKELTIQLLAERPRTIALAAKITVARCCTRRYTASRYTFSPPERGNMVPNSSQIKSPQESKNPATQSNRDAPTDPTDSRMVDGVENIPVPIIRPILDDISKETGGRKRRKGWVHEHCAAEYT